jgi:mono/diheme cytochrome c family protein
LVIIILIEMLKKINIGYCLAFVVICTLLACNNHNNTGTEFAPNMYYSSGYEPMSQLEGNNNKINPNGMNMRKPVKGTISRRNYQTKFGEGDSAKVDLMLYNLKADDIATAEATLKNPIAESEQSMEEGQALYEKFCQHCHGETGKGDGLVGKMYKGVPVYSSDALKTLNDGHIFHVITFGKGRMWPHGSQISPIDRWKIVQYVHKLQAE